MSNFINLDSYTKSDKTFQLGEKIYNVNKISVGDFVKLTQKQQEIEKKGNAVTMNDIYDLSIKIILAAVPDLTEEELMKLTSEQLNVLAKFIQEEETKEVETEVKK